MSLNNLSEVVHQFFQTSRAMTTTINQRFTEYKLTQGQLAIVDYLLVKGESTTLVDIAKYLRVEKSTVTRAVNHLEKNNFVEHAPSVDQRERRIQLTEFSLSILTRVQLSKDAFEKTVFKNISDDELAITYQTLQKIITNLHGDEDHEHG